MCMHFLDTGRKNKSPHKRVALHRKAGFLCAPAIEGEIPPHDHILDWEGWEKTDTNCQPLKRQHLGFSQAPGGTPNHWVNMRLTTLEWLTSRMTLNHWRQQDRFMYVKVVSKVVSSPGRLLQQSSCYNLTFNSLSTFRYLTDGHNQDSDTDF